MNFLNVGPLELAVILILAILLVGPKRVVEIVQTIRRFADQLRSMSSEFTSLIQTEMQTTEREASSQDEPQDTKRKTGGELKTIIKEGITPIASIQAELRATVQETRQALESIVKDELGPIAGVQADLQAAAQEARQALESPIQDGPGPSPSIQAELEATARETHQALEDIVTDATDTTNIVIVEDERGAKEKQNDKAEQEQV